VTVHDFRAEFLDSGQPAQYTADLSYVEDLGEEPREWTLRVNEPLRLSGANVYLLGHGYAPVLRYTDRYGVEFTMAVPFLTVDGMLTSQGVAKFPYANVPATGETVEPAQLGLTGVYQPTANPDPAVAASIFPA